MNIHERLQYLREKRNSTTPAFGASINMSGSSVTDMEKGVRNITDRTIRDICRTYYVNPDWLINGNEPVFNDPTRPGRNMWPHENRIVIYITGI